MANALPGGPGLVGPLPAQKPEGSDTEEGHIRPAVRPDHGRRRQAAVRDLFNVAGPVRVRDPDAGADDARRADSV
jgi:hypothetical protein